MRLDTPEPRPKQRGYTLVEALVVVALIGMLSVIAVPNFIQLYRSSKLKSSMRNFTADIRGARQRAVSETMVVVCSFPPVGAASNTYRFYQARLSGGAIDPTTLAAIPDGRGDPLVKAMDQDVYFSSTTFTDSVNTTAIRAADAGYLDIVFLTNGTLRTAAGTPQVQIRTDKPVPFPVYHVNFSVAGGVKVERP